ncbi:MAG: DoxX family protein [Edaphobacter sp.]
MTIVQTSWPDVTRFSSGASYTAMRLSHKSLAYALLRIAFGINFAGHGLIRIHNGVAIFAQTTAEHLAKSPLPSSLTYDFSYVIPFIEAILGLTLILGIFTRAVLTIGAVFMMLLTIGVTANQQWDIAGQQLLYSVIFFVLLFLHEHNAIALDNVLARSSKQ